MWTQSGNDIYYNKGHVNIENDLHVFNKINVANAVWVGPLRNTAGALYSTGLFSNNLQLAKTMLGGTIDKGIMISLGSDSASAIGAPFINFLNRDNEHMKNESPGMIKSLGGLNIVSKTAIIEPGSYGNYNPDVLNILKEYPYSVLVSQGNVTVLGNLKVSGTICDGTGDCLNNLDGGNVSSSDGLSEFKIFGVGGVGKIYRQVFAENGYDACIIGYRDELTDYYASTNGSCTIIQVQNARVRLRDCDSKIEQSSSCGTFISEYRAEPNAGDIQTTIQGNFAICGK